MYLTEEEARTKWCPQQRAPQGRGDYTNREGFETSTCCIASECMMWRWFDNSVIRQMWQEIGHSLENSDLDALMDIYMKRTENKPEPDARGYCGLGGKP
jgi:hypothetical protein